MDEFDIYIRSFRATVAERPEHALRRVFGLDEEQARDFVASLPRVVKRRVPASDRARYEKVLDAMGAELEFRRSPIQPMGAVLVKGPASSQANREAPRQPGNLLTLGEPLQETDGFASAERPAPVWPAPSAPNPRSTVVDPDAALTPAPTGGPAPHAPAATIHPVVPPGAQAAAVHPVGLGTAPTQRMEAVSVAEAAPPRVVAPAAVAAPATPVHSWTVANTPAASSTGEAFAGLQVRGPAHPTLRQQPSFSAAPPAASPAPAAASPAAASQAADAYDFAPLAQPPAAPAVVPASANPALVQAEAAALAVGWQDPLPTARAPKPASPAGVLAVPDAVRAYADASTADSLARDAQGAAKTPSWLVDEASLRAGASAAPPAAHVASVAPNKPLSLEPQGPPAPALSLEGESEEGGGAWLLSVGNERGARARARGGARRAGPLEAPAAVAAPAAPPGVGQAAVSVSRMPPASAGSRPSAVPVSRARSTGLEAASLPLGVRLLLRVGLGVSLFLLLLTLRACPFRKSAVERELQQWGATGESGTASSDESVAIRAETARDWIEGGNHHFRDAQTGDVIVDKDPIRGLISRLQRLGAREVYVYGLVTVDLIVYAEGLDVVLPEDQEQRAAIFLEESRFHRLDAPSVPDTGQARLRISVP